MNRIRNQVGINHEQDKVSGGKLSLTGSGIRWEVIMNRIMYEVGSNHEQDHV